VKDILMPPIGLLTGGLDFSNQFMILKSWQRTPRPASPRPAQALRLVP
jgi:large-conductance mechanosensitive channel